MKPIKIKKEDMEDIMDDISEIVTEYKVKDRHPMEIGSALLNSLINDILLDLAHPEAAIDLIEQSITGLNYIKEKLIARAELPDEIGTDEIRNLKQ